jgi:hypothetical protein
MLPTTAIRFLLVLPLLLVAASFLGISASILVRGRPLMLRGRLITWALFAVWAPLAVAVVLVASSVREPAMTCLAFSQIAVAAAIILAARRAVRGYLVIGISECVFREYSIRPLPGLGFPSRRR